MRTSFAQQHRLPPLLPSTFRMRSTCTSFVFSVGLCVFGHGFLFNPLPHSNPPNIYIYIYLYIPFACGFLEVAQPHGVILPHHRASPTIRHARKPTQNAGAQPTHRYPLLITVIRSKKSTSKSIQGRIAPRLHRNSKRRAQKDTSIVYGSFSLYHIVKSENCGIHHINILKRENLVHETRSAKRNMSLIACALQGKINDFQNSF